jgi:5-formyltetrahydrofolate cyclo-ligase
MQGRTELRRNMRARRRSLDRSQRIASASALAGLLARNAIVLNSRRIACYLPNDGEIDTAPLIDRLWNLRKAVYLPVLVPFAGNRLWFARYKPGDRLVANRFGIPEPERIHRDRIPPCALDLVLAPLVAFDTNGNRLGMGGGFYDHSLQFLRWRNHWKRPLFVGLAFDFQRLGNLPAREWDVPLSAVATDSSIYRFTAADTAPRRL